MRQACQQPFIGGTSWGLAGAGDANGAPHRRRRGDDRQAMPASGSPPRREVAARALEQVSGMQANIVVVSGSCTMSS